MSIFDSIKNFFIPKAKPVPQIPASFGSAPQPQPLSMSVTNKLSGLEAKPLPKDFFNLATTPKIDVQAKLANYGKQVQENIKNAPPEIQFVKSIVQALPRAVGTIAKTVQEKTGDKNSPIGINKLIEKSQGTNLGSSIFGTEPVLSQQEKNKGKTGLGKALAVGGTLLDLIPGVGGEKNGVEESLSAIAKTNKVEDIISHISDIFKSAKVTKTPEEIAILADKYKDITNTKIIADDLKNSIKGAVPEEVVQVADHADFVVGPKKQFDDLTKKASQFDERFKAGQKRQPFVPSEMKDEIPRGAENILARLRAETQFGLSAERKLMSGTEELSLSKTNQLYDKAQLAIPREDIDKVSKFIDTIGTHLFDDVGMSVWKGSTKQGQYDFAKNLVTIYKKNIIDSGGKFDRTIMHELWHGLSRYLPTEKISTVTAQHLSDVKSYIKKNPWFRKVYNIANGEVKTVFTKQEYEDLIKEFPELKKTNYFQMELSDYGRQEKYHFKFNNENYRLKNIDEWFAENLTDKSLDKFSQMDKGAQSIIQYGKNIIRSFIDSIKRTFGYDVAGELRDNFFKGHYQDMVRNEMNLRMGGETALTDIGKSEPSLPKTLGKNPTISQEIKDSIDQLRYKPITNVETLDEANKIIDKDIDSAVTYFRDIKKPDRVSNTVGQVLVKRLQDAGRMDDAIDVAIKLTDDATKSGQAVQVFSIINRLSPEGVLKYAVRSINRAGGDAKKIITPEFAQKITKAAEDIQRLPEGSREKQVETSKLLRDIMNEVPKGLLKKISSFQTIAQLLNPKTTVRNILGNLIFNAAENVKDLPATILDYATSAVTGTRTTSLPDLMANARGFKRGITEGTQEAISGINTSRSNTMYDINKQNVFKEGSALSYTEKALNVLNTSVDRGFYEAAFDGALAKSMKAKGVTDASKITDSMIEDAATEAAYRTFQDESVVASAFMRMKNALNFGKDFGIGDFIIKYPKVPGNIFSRGMAYSPLGFANTVMELGKPLIGKQFNQKQFVESTARAITGTTGLFGTGALLNKLGILTASEKRDDYKTQNFKRELGLGKYKINVTALKRFIASGMDPEEAKLKDGDTLASYDWAQPAALSLAMGADFNENKGSEDAFINKIGSTFGNISDVVLSGSASLEEQPVLRGLKNLFGGDTLGEGVGKVLSGVPVSFVPTILRQFRNVIDDNARITSGNDPFSIAYKQTLNAIPGASSTLQSDVTSFGEDKPTFGATKNNIWNVFFNPSFVAKYKPSKEATLVMDVFTNSGDSSAIPRRYTKYVQLGNEKKNITAEQQRYYQRFLGVMTKKSLTNLVNSKDATIGGENFYNLSDEDKAKKLDSLFTDINSAAKITLFGYKPKRVNTRTKNLIKFYESNPFVHREKGLVK